MLWKGQFKPKPTVPKPNQTVANNWKETQQAETESYTEMVSQNYDVPLTIRTFNTFSFFQRDKGKRVIIFTDHYQRQTPCRQIGQAGAALQQLLGNSATTPYTGIHCVQPVTLCMSSYCVWNARYVRCNVNCGSHWGKLCTYPQQDKSCHLSGLFQCSITTSFSIYVCCCEPTFNELRSICF